MISLPQAIFPSHKHHENLRQASKTLSGENYSLLKDADRYHLHAYDYGFRRVFLLNREARSPIDRDGAWYDEKLADQVERMYWREKGCERQWGTCRERWDHRGVICGPGCRLLIPNYQTLSEDEVRVRQLFNEEKLTDRKAAWEWRSRVAAAYRWARDNGKTMKADLDNHDPTVLKLVEEFEKDLEMRIDTIKSVKYGNP